MVHQGESFAIIKPEESQKFEKPIRIAEMQMLINPMEEWKQILTDAWRIERDYFYDPNMHGVNWDAGKRTVYKNAYGRRFKGRIKLYYW